MLSISPANPQPLYLQVVDQLRALILAGDLSPGDPLPSVRQLAIDIATSVITTRRAYLELEREGLIVTRPGRGTFVAELDAHQRRSAALALLQRELGGWLARAQALGVEPRALQDLLDSAIEREVRR
ncbi:MAG: GntR family transcriptional regulator [bacterium]|nr:GntR family transcriptional regulator [bacterium]